mgnify:FL=1
MRQKTHQFQKLDNNGLHFAGSDALQVMGSLLSNLSNNKGYVPVSSIKSCKGFVCMYLLR